METVNTHCKNPEQWPVLPRKIQLLNIAEKINQAAHKELWSRQEKAKVFYEGCMDLIDMTIVDPKWHEETGELYQLRDAVASLYVGKTEPEIPRLLYTLIVKMADKF